MRYAHTLRVGPVSFRVGSDWRAPIDALRSLYRDYPGASDGVADYSVRLEAARPWRRWLRPAITLGGDFMLPDAVPLPLAWGLLAAEMGMNLQLALGERRYLLLHAASVERDGRALVLTGASGSGKSTLSAVLAAKGWRLMGDEFALIDPASGLLHAFPRLVSLKNGAIGEVAGARLGPLLRNTPKGDIRHLVPDAAAVAAMDRPARIAAVVFPAFGHHAAVRPVPASEAFVRLTQASTNYTALGERGFGALTDLVGRAPAVAIDYPDSASALEQVAALWDAL